MFEISLLPSENLTEIEQLWCQIERKSDASFFQSWAWMGTWLTVLPDDRKPHVLLVSHNHQPAAIASVSFRKVRRHGVVNSHGLFLNATGDPQFDVLTIEYNGFLVDKDRELVGEHQILKTILQHVPNWDEIYLDGVPDHYESEARKAGLTTHLSGVSTCRYVDLDRIRTSDAGYLDQLSRNTRYQIRRSIRRYEERGTIELRAAENATEAQHYFSELKKLHQSYWTSRGEPGSFSNPFFEEFHRALLDRYADTGEVQILRLAVDGKPVGYLYNFVWRNCVYNYQSGFEYEDDNVIKPGLVSHYLAIDSYLSQGKSRYDFLAGESQHKSSLATDGTGLKWLRARRPAIKYAIEDTLRRGKRILSSGGTK